MLRITGTTQLAGVIGWPIEHTLSPVMHNAAYEHLGLDWVYIPLGVADEIGFRRVVAAIRALPFVGFSVTMPYKALALELCDEVAVAADMAGAVNAVHCVDGRLVGYNTDGRGLLETLGEDAGFDPEGKRVVVLGTGGAAGGAITAFILGRAERIHVVGRDISKAELAISRVAQNLNSTEADAVTFQDAEAAIREADLIVNATPVGMSVGDPSPIPAAWIQEDQIVLDMVYGGFAETALLTEARAAGAIALDGLGMLVCQGATAIDIWNPSRDTKTPRAPMRTAAEAELARRAGTGEAVL